MNDLPNQIVADFLAEYRASRVYSRGRIAELAELAINEDNEVAKSATRAFFTGLVETLADSFEPETVSLYNRAIAQVIQACRADPRAVQLHHELERCGLHSEEDLIARANRLRKTSLLTSVSESRDYIQRLIVLSRVTLGADVAITSVIVERMKHRFPSAEIVLVGGAKMQELFGGDQQLRFKEIGYGRAGTTIERLLSWVDLLRGVGELTDGLRPGAYLIVDPDSRFTQLGLLPVGNTDFSQPDSLRRDGSLRQEVRDYLFFPSREYGAATAKSLSELTSVWLDELFGESKRTYPRVSLRPKDIETAHKLVSEMKATRAGPVVSINFGVGENPMKRLGDEFEVSLVAQLIQEGASIVLDKGAGEDEIKRAEKVISELTKLERDGRSVRAMELNELTLTGALDREYFDAPILVWNGRVGMLAALIAQSDLYIGYDSAGAHIAAALGVPCIDVFAGFSSVRFVDRWRPTGTAEPRVAVVDTPSGNARTNDALSEVLRNADALLKSRGFD